ncbi:ribosome-associated translation inhibitor RaiA [bacterium]|nr:ribosome-associated translation inhibitor RaiA [bacterium]
MRIDFQGLNDYVLEPRFTDHARPRLESLAHFSGRLRDTRVTVEVVRGRYTVEITCDVDGLVLRAETVNNDQLEAFDEALDRLERQLVRYKQKLVRRRKQGPRRGEAPGQGAVPEPEPEPADEEEAGLEEFKIVRVKAHELKPMSPQEAVLQMELVGHDFYVFYDDTARRVGVVYKRKSGDYGLIEPEVGQE